MPSKGRIRKKPTSKAHGSSSQAHANQLASLTVSQTAGGHSPAAPAAAPAATPPAASLKPTLPTTAARPRYQEMARLQSLRAVKADNIWDLFFPELQDKILRYAGPLTRFLCGRLEVAKMDDAAKRALWVDVFKQEWQGSLARLPFVLLTPKDIAHVTTRTMYERLSRFFPDYCQQPWITYIPMKNMWLDLVHVRLDVNTAVMAAEANCADFVAYMFDVGFVTIEDFEEEDYHLLGDATSRGHLEMVQYLSFRGDIEFTESTMDVAAGSGNLDLVKWLHANRKEGCTEDAMDNAAGSGNLDLVKWLHANRKEGCTYRAMNKAAENGHLPVVQWLHSNRTEGCTKEALDKAAESGHLEVIQWLHANRTEGCTTDAMDNAAKGGHLHVVQWLHFNRTEGCTTDAMDLAASHGRLHVIQWLHANRTEGCTTQAMDNAAVCGHLEVVQWLAKHRTEGFTHRAYDMALNDKVKQFLLDSLTPAQRDAMQQELNARVFQQMQLWRRQQQAFFGF